MGESSDEALVRQAAAGDPDAFGQLARRWRGPLYRLGYHLAGNREEAEDICQEALIKAYRGLGGLEDHRKFPHWVRRIAVRVFQDRRRRDKGKQVVSLGLMRDGEETVDLLDRWVPEEMRSGGPAADLEAHERRGILEEALGLLPEEQRQAIVMREFHDLTTPEIAEITGVPTATVRTRIFYGLRKLHDHLSHSRIWEE